MGPGRNWLVIAMDLSVMLLHLRTAGKTSDHVGWCSNGMWSPLTFATMVTRAGGVWAVSVHTFVVDSAGSPPGDVFGRIMVLLSDASGIEVVVYFLGILQFLGIFLASRLGFEFSKYWLALLPAVAIIGIIGGDVFKGFPPTLVMILD